MLLIYIGHQKDFWAPEKDINCEIWGWQHHAYLQMTCKDAYREQTEGLTGSPEICG